MLLNKKSIFFLIFILLLCFLNFLKPNILKNHNGELNDQKVNNDNFIQQLFDNGGYLTKSENKNYWENNFLVEQIYSDGRDFQNKIDNRTIKWDDKIKGNNLEIKNESAQITNSDQKIYKYEKLKELKITGHELKSFKFGDKKKINNEVITNTLNLDKLDLSKNYLNDFLGIRKNNSLSIGDINLDNENLKYLNISNNQQHFVLENSDWFLGNNILSKNNKGKSLKTLLMDNLGENWKNVFPASEPNNKNLRNLKQLSIKNMGIINYSIFENKIKSNFSNLEIINLSNNKIVDLNLTSESKNLIDLKLNSNNKLKSISFVDDLNLKTLFLDVSDKNSKLLENIDFSNLKKLNKLSLVDRKFKGEVKIPSSVTNVNLSKNTNWEEGENKMILNLSNFDDNFKNIEEFNLNNRSIKKIIFKNFQQTKNFYDKFTNKHVNNFNFEQIVLKDNNSEKIANFFKEISLKNNNTKLEFVNNNGFKLKEYLERQIGFKLGADFNLNDYFSDMNNVNLDFINNKFNNLTSISLTQSKNIDNDFKLKINELKLPDKLVTLIIDNFALKKLTNLEKNTKLTKISLKNNLLENNELILKNLKELSEIDLSVTIDQNNKNSWLKIIDLTDNVKIDKIVTSYDENTIDNAFKIIYGSDNSQKDKIIASLKKGNSYLNTNWNSVKEKFKFESKNDRVKKIDLDSADESKEKISDEKKIEKNTNLFNKWINLIAIGSIFSLGIIIIIIYRYFSRKNVKIQK